jgi:hypothetical protein
MCLQQGSRRRDLVETFLVIFVLGAVSSPMASGFLVLRDDLLWVLSS